MIDLLILAYVSKWFYELAKKFNRPRKWVYIVSGIVTYIVFGYASVFAIILMTISGKNISGFAIGLLPSLMAIPFGILGVWLLYIFLERQWSREESKKMSSWSKEIKSEDGLLDESLDL